MTIGHSIYEITEEVFVNLGCHSLRPKLIWLIASCCNSYTADQDHNKHQTNSPCQTRRRPAREIQATQDHLQKCYNHQFLTKFWAAKVCQVSFRWSSAYRALICPGDVVKFNPYNIIEMSPMSLTPFLQGQAQYLGFD